MNRPDPGPSLGRDAAGRAQSDPSDDPTDTPHGDAAPGPVCERCGQPMLDRHCKVVCLNCGYQRDCSDP